jgi:hypothetical protein
MGRNENPPPADPAWRDVAGRLAALHPNPLRRGRRWSTRVPVGWSVAVVIGVAACFAAVSLHYNDTVLDAKACPSTVTVNAPLGTTLDSVSSVQFPDLHSCHYRQGADTGALWIDAAVGSAPGSPSLSDRCRGGPSLQVAGYPACSVRDTAGRASLYIETRRAQWQFTTNLASVAMPRLETLAATLLKEKPPLFS